MNHNMNTYIVSIPPGKFPFSFVLAFIFFTGFTIAQGSSDYPKLSEPKLILSLESKDPEVRKQAAREIRTRLAQQRFVIGEGNIIEHNREFWENKVGMFREMADIIELLDTFSIITANLKPNYDDIKIFRIDHMFLIYVEMNPKRTKGKVIRLQFEPQVIKVAQPRSYTGLWKVYNLIGEIAIETSYKKGKKHGVETINYNDGNTCWSKIYEEGKIMSLRSYSQTGELTSEKVFTEAERKVWEEQEMIEAEYWDNN